ncbi:transposase [Endozoicomonas lisbonensis]|uniref:transposase n=1 Tax=Endozoicomonas lisbonensis TaxID=3120522 RepID=UPI003AF101BE
MTNWHQEIFCYFDSRVTNAYTESVNNLIKVLHKVGRGYSFEALRAKILFPEGLHKAKRPKFDKRKSRKVSRKTDTDCMYFMYSLPYRQEEEIYSGVSISTLTEKLETDEF